MTKYTITLILIFSLTQIRAQVNCKLDTISHYKHINFDEYDYKKIDTTIRKNVHFNCYYQCPETKTIILGNRSIIGNKKGYWLVKKSNGVFILSGNFKRNKMHGKWHSSGTCYDIYKKGKQNGFVCPNFKLN